MAEWKWEESSLILTAKAQEAEIELYTAGLTIDRLEIDPSDSWITVPSNYVVSDGIYFTIAVAANGNLVSRSGIITAYATDETSAVLTITQNGDQLIVTPTAHTFSAEGGKFSFDIDTGSGYKVSALTENSIFNYTASTDSLTFECPSNETENEIQESFRLVATRALFNKTIVLTQQARTGETYDLGIISVWRDNPISYKTSSSALTFNVYVDGRNIYNGKAYKMPDASEITINPNRIVENYIWQELDLDKIKSTAPQSNDYACRRVEVKLGANIYDYTVVDDWSYDLNFNLRTGMTLSDPAYNYADSRQLCPRTYINALSQMWTEWLPTADSTIYEKAKNGCHHNYVIYYVNLYGGWDALLFNGKSEPSMTLTKSTAKRSVNNTKRIHGERQWNIGMTEKWKLRTDYLSPEQSEKMKHVVTSNLVYLHDMENDRIIPVNVTDTSFTEKNEYVKRGSRYYEFTVQRAIEMNRR